MRSLDVLLKLLISHLIVTAFLSNKIFSAGNYREIIKSKWLYISSAIYAVLIYAILSSWNDIWFIPSYFLAFIIIFFFCSLIKYYPIRILISQVILIISLLFSWFYSTGITSFPISSKLISLWNSKNVLLIIFGFIILIWPIGPFIGILTEPFRRQLNDEELTKGLAKAGLWIGCIERTIIYIFVLSNFITAIAFLVTAKSIFRFGEISKSTNRKEAEYILIGTLMSYSVAMVIGYLIKYFLE